jgi:hypothetical protein
MRITKSQLDQIIFEKTEEMLSYDHPSEVETVEDAYAGGENLVLSLDHSKTMGGEPVTDSPEHWSYEEERPVQIPQIIQVTESQLRGSIRKILLRTQ